ncbi:hypothetical protein [Cupriavidus necator]
MKKASIALVIVAGGVMLLTPPSWLNIGFVCGAVWLAHRSHRFPRGALRRQK